jgi:hypothetical protein
LVLVLGLELESILVFGFWLLDLFWICFGFSFMSLLIVLVSLFLWLFCA